MRFDLDALRHEARDQFLGDGDIVGVAESDEIEGLVFVLKRPSRTSEQRIKRWAGVNGVNVHFFVVGRPRLSGSENGHGLRGPR